MPYKIQMRRGTAAEWAAANPTPSAGEICVEIDTLKVKVGNGTDAWADLAYLVGGGGSGVTDHGALTGLGDDDHTQYLKVDGTRALTGDLSVTEGKKIDGVDVSAHDAATTGVHGVGVGTIAKVGDIATDGNLSAAAQDAVAKRHAEAHTLTSHSTRAHSELTGIGATDHHSNANDPGAGEKAALPGTSGTPGADNKYVTNADSRNSDARTPLAHSLASHSSKAHSELTGVGATDHHSNANDPSAGEKAALPGTSGTPSGTNKYVTNDDSRNSDARTPTSHNHAATDITTGSLDGDRLAAPTSTKRGGVKPTGTPSGKFLKDDDTWDTPAGGTPASFQLFTADGTWTKPAGAKLVYIECVGAGSGGSGGEGQAAGATRVPGGAAGGGGLSRRLIPADALSATVAVTVGSGGAGGAGGTNAVGVQGGAGGNSTFGSFCTGFRGGYGKSTSGNRCAGGGGGGSASGGTDSDGWNPSPGGYPGATAKYAIGGQGGQGDYSNANAVGTAEEGGGGGGACYVEGPGSTGGGSLRGGGGGGVGGGVSSANVHQVGRAGGANLTYGFGGGGTFGAVGGGNGGVGTNGDGYHTGGAGGGGGGGNSGGTGGAGGNGGAPGGGGGGGGGGTTTGGNGGAGGRGEVRVWVWF